MAPAGKLGKLTLRRGKEGLEEIDFHVTSWYG